MNCVGPLLPDQGGPCFDLLTSWLLIGIQIFSGVFGGYFLIQIWWKLRKMGYFNEHGRNN